MRGGQNSANLVKAGLDAGRSAVHMTDNVLLPDDVFYTIMMALEYYPESSILQNLVDATPDLAKVANNPRTNVTVFAPGNSAFLLVGPTFIPRLEADNRTRLNGLNYHISPGARFVPGGFPAGSRIPTLLKGQDIGVKIAVTKGAGGKEQGTVVLVPTSGPDATIAVRGRAGQGNRAGPGNDRGRAGAAGGRGDVTGARGCGGAALHLQSCCRLALSHERSRWSAHGSKAAARAWPRGPPPPTRARCRSSLSAPRTLPPYPHRTPPQIAQLPPPHCPTSLCLPPPVQNRSPTLSPAAPSSTASPACSRPPARRSA